MTNQELIMLVVEAYDTGFRAGFSYSDWGGDENKTLEILTDQDYIGRRDDWIRARVSEDTTA